MEAAVKVKRVAIIGAGASGLPALKECQEAGLEATCFERTGHMGGLWRFREDVTDGHGSVMKSTIINTSKVRYDGQTRQWYEINYY